MPLNSSRQQINKIRLELSSAANWLASTLLGMLLLCVGFMWIYAWSKGLYPNPHAPYKETYEAVWGDNDLLVNAYYFLLFLPGIPFIISILSCIIKPNRFALVLMLCCALCFYLILFHLKLIDD